MVIPRQGHEAVSTVLHEEHPAMTRMREMSRMYVWWPRQNKYSKDYVSACTECQMLQLSPPVAPPPHPLKWPICPGARINLDFAGLVWKKVFSFD